MPIHTDQANNPPLTWAILSTYLQPWKEYDFWSNEVWAVNGKWLEDPANQKVVADVMEAQLRANHLATTDFGWFAGMFRK